MKTVLIQVTKKDIKLGQRLDNCRCPVARAVKRKIKFKSVRVTDEQLELYNKKYFETLRLPTEATQFIRAFDSHASVKPFKFKIQLK